MTHPEFVGLRIGDAERERMTTALSEHYAAGRLTLEEFSARTEAATAARTSGDLLRLSADLPRPMPLDVVPPRPMSTAAPLTLPVLLADLFFGILGPLALLCLFMLLGVASSREFFAAFFAAVGGAVSCGAAVHFVHRAAARQRQADVGRPSLYGGPFGR